jgi:hypothetical protein
MDDIRINVVEEALKFLRSRIHPELFENLDT